LARTCVPFRMGLNVACIPPTARAIDKTVLELGPRSLRVGTFVPGRLQGGRICVPGSRLRLALAQGSRMSGNLRRPLSPSWLLVEQVRSSSPNSSASFCPFGHRDIPICYGLPPNLLCVDFYEIRLLGIPGRQQGLHSADLAFPLRGQSAP
jgi:hypothetical protein